MSNKCLYCYKEIDHGNRDFHYGCSKEFFGHKNAPIIPYSIGQMTELAKRVVERSVTVPGVQAKLSMTLVKETQGTLDARLTVVGALGGNYIFKPPSEHYEQMPENEHLTMRMAEAFGIRVVPSSLIRLASGELSYITRRVDRKQNGEKIHMIDMFQITEAFDKYRSSMEKVGKALSEYSENTMLDKLFYFELAIFSFLTGNNDMHLKNFSMLESSTGWLLAPAYDLLNVAIILPEDDEELALTLGGRKKKLKRSDFDKFGVGLGLNDKQIQGTFDRFGKQKMKAENLIKESFLSKEMQDAYFELMNERSIKLNL